MCLIINVLMVYPSPTNSEDLPTVLFINKGDKTKCTEIEKKNIHISY